MNTTLKKRMALLGLALWGCLSPAFAQDAAPAEASGTLIAGVSNTDVLIWMFVGASFILFFAVILVIGLYMTLVNRAIARMPKPEEAAVETVHEKSAFWRWFFEQFNAAAPEQDVMLDHDYDGIHELDNSLPPWWKYGFYVSIFFAVFYIYYYHFAYASTEPVSVAEYHAEMIEAEAAKKAYLAKAANSINEDNVEFAEDAIPTGKDIFMKNCQACHGNAGQGGVGPNLTDEYWLHGGSIKDVFTIVKYGVREKGMLPWEDKLTPKQMQEVSSFILSLQGTNPEGAKDAQGEKYVPEEK